MRFISAVRRSRRLQAGVVIVALAVAAGAVILGRDYIERRRYQQRFEHEIRLSERLISERRLDQAEERLRNASAIAVGETSWLRILKRAHRVDELRGDHTAALLYELARRAAVAEPAVESLQAVAVEGAIRSGEYEFAAERAAGALTSDRYGDLVAEAQIAAGAYAEDPAGAELEAMHPLVRLIAAETPERHLHAYEITEDMRFVVNAALLFLARGNPERASQILEGVALEPQAALVEALVAYELGEYERARAELSRLPGPVAVEAPALLLLAELELRAGRHDEAARLYQELQTTDPDHAAALWYNHAALIDDRELRLDLLAEALQRFPEDLRLISAYVEAGGDPDAVLGGAEAPYRALFRFRARQLQESGGVTAVSELWDLHNKHPENSKIAAALARKLVAVRDHGGLERVVRRFAERDDAHWARQYAGALAHRRGEFALAGEAFDEGYAPRRLWQSAHNRAAHAVLARDPEAINEALAPALAAVKGVPGYARERAKLLHIEALGLYLEGELGAARELVLEAVSEDPDNFELRRFLRNLETALQ